MIADPPRSLRSTHEIAGALIGGIGLVTQFVVSISNFMADGMTFGGAAVRYFSFFTILSNMLLVACYAASLLGSSGRVARFFQSPRVQTGAAVYILIVSTIYVFILQSLWNPQGIARLLDIVFHYVAPVIYVLYWLLFVRKGTTSYKDIIFWLGPLLVYVAYLLIRGAFTGLYPYPFLYVPAIGYADTFRNIGLIFVYFLVLSLTFVALDRRLGRNAVGGDLSLTGTE